MDSLQPGPANTLVEDVVYALPGRHTFLQSSAVLETSLDGVTFTAVSATTTGVDISALFVRCTTTTATVVCKTY